MYRIIGSDGQQYGPVTPEVVRQWIAEGRANAQSKIQAEGTSEWRTLGELSEFAAALTGARASTPTTTPVIVAEATKKTNGLAVTGLILGVISVTLGLCCIGLPFNVAGIVCSSIALVQIRKNSSWQQGRGLAIAGLVLSVLSLVLAILLIGLRSAIESSEWMQKIEKL